MCQKLSRYFNNGKLLLRQNLWSQQSNGKRSSVFQNFLRLKIVLYHRFWPGDKQNCYLSKFIGTSVITQKKLTWTYWSLKGLRKCHMMLATKGVVQGVSFVQIDFLKQKIAPVWDLNWSLASGLLIGSSTRITKQVCVLYMTSLENESKI
jgi:hypothetical protein